MIQKRQVYHCAICGNTIEVLYAGAPALVCCGKPMELLNAKSADEGVEKHLPVILAEKDGIRVKVGSTPHPMLENHHIVFIEVLTEDQVLRAELSAGASPEAVFCVEPSRVLSVREYCNIHGLWEKKA